MRPLPPQPTIECVIAQFRRGLALVDAAAAALDRLAAALDAGSPGSYELLAILDAAAVDGDNLLVAPPGEERSTTVLALARSNGGPVRVQTIDIGATALAGGSGPLDAVLAARARNQADGSALRRLGERAAVVASALSIAKSRLDLQASFLDAVRGEAPAAPRPGEAATSDTVRALALAAGRQLGARRMPLAARNRHVLEALFARAVTVAG